MLLQFGSMGQISHTQKDGHSPVGHFRPLILLSATSSSLDGVFCVLLDELMQEHPALSYLVRSVPGMPNGLPSSKARLALASKNWHQFRHNIPYIYL